MEVVYEAMQRLNPAQQEVLTLRFMGELSSEEVSSIMNRTNGAVRELQRTALKALRGLLTAQDQEVETGVVEERDA